MGLVRRGINLDNKKFFEHFKELNYRILISIFIVSTLVLKIVVDLYLFGKVNIVWRHNYSKSANR